MTRTLSKTFWLMMLIVAAFAYVGSSEVWADTTEETHIRTDPSGDGTATVTISKVVHTCANGATDTKYKVVGVCKPCKSRNGGNEIWTTTWPDANKAANNFSCNASVIDNETFTYSHDAEDYGHSSVGSCVSCGGGEAKSDLACVHLKRFHQTRASSSPSSFGPGVYSNFDTKLRFYAGDNANFVDVVDPFVLTLNRYVDGPYAYAAVTNDTRDGIFRSVRSNAAVEIRLLNSSGELVSAPADAATAVLKCHDGNVLKYELIDMASSSGIDSSDLELYLALDETSGTTAADSSTNNRDGALTGSSSWVTGKVNGGLGEAAGGASSWADEQIQVASGSYTETSGTYSISSAGGHVWGTEDKFHYIYRPLTGDGTIVAKVASLSHSTNPMAKAGVMIRERLTSESKMAQMTLGYSTVTPTETTNSMFMARSGPDSSVNQTQANGNIGEWVRLVRSGSTITGYRSTDGSSWTEVGSKEIDMADEIYIGIFATANNDSSTCSASISDVSITGDTTDWTNPPGGEVTVTGYKGIDGSSARTVMAWVKTTQPGPIVAWGENATGEKFVVELADKGGFYGVLGCDVNGGNIYGAANVADGQWHHIAVSMEAGSITNEIKLYVDGQLQGISEVASASIETDVLNGIDLLIGKDHDGNHFEGVLDEVQIYDRAVTPEEMTYYGEDDSVWYGRVIRMEDRRGYGVTVSYKAWTQTEIDQSPSLQWQIDTATDDCGRTLTFSYGANQVSGRYAVSSVTLPNSESIDYTYSGGYLSQIDYPDNTTSTFSRTNDSSTGFTKFVFDDKHAEPTHRKKEANLTSSVIVADEDGKVFPQPTGLIRYLENGNGELSYMNIVADGTVGANVYVYEGGGKLKRFAQGKEQYMEEWAVGNNSDALAYDDIAVTKAEDNYGQDDYTGTDSARGEPTSTKDMTGRLKDYEYNSAGSITKR